MSPNHKRFQQRLPFGAAAPSRCSSLLNNKQIKPQEIFRVNRPRQITEAPTQSDSAAIRILRSKRIWPYFERFWALKPKVVGTFFVSLGYDTWRLTWRHWDIKVSLQRREALGMQRVRVVRVKRRAALKVPKHEGSGSSVSPQLGKNRNAPCVNLRGLWLQKLLCFPHTWSEKKGVFHPKSEWNKEKWIFWLLDKCQHIQPHVVIKRPRLTATAVVRDM